MTPLRKNLEQAKAGYGEIRYRGDLARDVLGAMPVSSPIPNLWRRRALAIAAAIALSATTFFAGSRLGHGTPANEEVALTTPPVKATDPTIVIRPKTPENVTAQVATESFTLVPSLASADDTQTNASSTVASAQQSSMDFSTSVPSAPMLFSLATLADQETQTESTNGTGINGAGTNESETRS